MDKVIALILLVLFSSCQKNEYFGPVNVSDDSILESQTSNLLYIGCEGNFQYNNASLSVLNLEEDKVENDVFSRTNGFQVGDVLQSILHHGDSLYLVINNSGLIRIINDSTFEQIAVIEGFNSPRYMLMIDRKHAVVSDFGGQELTVIDVSNAQIIDKVSTATWTERMVQVEDKLYVSNMTDSSVLVFGLPSFNLSAEIDLGIEPSYLFEGKTDVMIVGNGKSGSRIVKLDQFNQTQAIQSFNTRLSGAVLYDSIIYLLRNNVVNQLNVSTLESISFNHAAQTPYSIFVDQSGIYISDVLDYLSKGKVLKYSHSSELLNTCNTGLIPQALAR